MENKNRTLAEFKPCDICVDETCKKNGKAPGSCDCKNCRNVKSCYKFLHATIRITDRCTQSCEHCGFSCTPTCNRFMSVEKAKDIHRFLVNNGVYVLNVMGGEFFCNKYWYEILDILCDSMLEVRLVSNGDWAGIKDVEDKLESLYRKYKGVFHVSISRDRWHTNKNVVKAAMFLNKSGIKYDVGDGENDSENSIVPIGRGDATYGTYSMFSCYCNRPMEMYAFLITEDGTIYRCGFGVLDFAKVSDYLDGGFRSKVKEFYKKFDDIFIPSCRSCINAAMRGGHLDLFKKNKGGADGGSRQVLIRDKDKQLER